VNSRSGIQLQYRIIEIGAIVAYTFIALWILLIVFSWIHPWKTSEAEIYSSNVSVDWKNSIFRTESTLVPPIDEEEIRSVLVEYKRITAQLHSIHAMDFTRCKSVGAVFKNTKPVVIPFVMKSSKLPSRNNGGAEQLTTPVIPDDIFDEKGTASDSSVKLCALPGSERVDSGSNDIGFESPRIRRALSFYTMRESMFEISRTKPKLQKDDSSTIVTNPSVTRLSIQLDLVTISSQRSTESGEF